MRNITEQEKTIVEYVDAHREEMLSLWKRLAEIESPSENKTAVDSVGQILAEELAQTGAEVHIEEMSGGDLVWANWNCAPGVKPVIFCGHMDTVFAAGTLAEMPVVLRDGKLYGPGVLDMKGGLVIALYALKALAAAGGCTRPVRVVFVGDEETGHAGSSAAERIKALSRGAAAALNFETSDPEGGIVVERKGSCTLQLEVTGVAAHAGRSPEAGRSAILEMAHKVIAIQALNDLPRGTSVNVGVISGGTVVNAIPGKCRAEIDIRYTDRALAERVFARIREIAETCTVDGCSGCMTIESDGEAMPVSEQILKLFAHVQETARDIGCGELHPVTSGGWSDANLMASVGVPVVCGIGVQGEFNHAPGEYALVDSLYQRTKLAAAVVLRMA